MEHLIQKGCHAYVDARFIEELAFQIGEEKGVLFIRIRCINFVLCGKKFQVN